MDNPTYSSTWNRFWHEPLRAERLALMRILLGIALLLALIITALLTAKSIHDFSQTGPEIKKEIRDRYVAYSLLALEIGRASCRERV